MDLESRSKKRKLSTAQRVRVPEGRQVMETKEESNFKKESITSGNFKSISLIDFSIPSKKFQTAPQWETE